MDPGVAAWECAERKRGEKKTWYKGQKKVGRCLRGDSQNPTEVASAGQRQWRTLTEHARSLPPPQGAGHRHRSLRPHILPQPGQQTRPVMRGPLPGLSLRVPGATPTRTTACCLPARCSTLSCCRFPPRAPASCALVFYCPHLFVVSSRRPEGPTVKGTGNRRTLPAPSKKEENNRPINNTWSLLSRCMGISHQHQYFVSSASADSDLYKLQTARGVQHTPEDGILLPEPHKQTSS